MSSKKHAAALAVVIATALVPSFAAQAAEASPAPIVPLELCHPKWVLPPNTTQIPDSSSNGRDQTGGTGPGGWQTVAHDDMTYDGC
jgi:hypothetical protein